MSDDDKMIEIAQNVEKYEENMKKAGKVFMDAVKENDVIVVRRLVNKVDYQTLNKAHDIVVFAMCSYKAYLETYGKHKKAELSSKCEDAEQIVKLINNMINEMLE